MASPSPPPPPPPPSASVSAKKKPQGLPWTHQETVNLIQAYQEKWYSLKRGQLKSDQWEEVAVTVASRCGYDNSHPSKTAIQCRHKMEKLRQRYRVEKQRLAPGAAAASWHFFHSMDLLERGPLPIPATPILALPYHHRHARDQKQQDEDGNNDDGENYNKSRSINCILRRPTIVNGFVAGDAGSGLQPAGKRGREAVDEDCEVMVEVLGKKGRDLLVLRLAREIRDFGERFVDMENMKMEFLKQTERCRMEMESKRMEMILKSQDKIVDSIARAFESSNQFNMAPHEI